MAARKTPKRSRAQDRALELTNIDREIARSTQDYGKPPATFVRVARVALAVGDALGNSDVYVGAIKDGVYTVTLPGHFGFTLLADGKHTVWGAGEDGDWTGEIRGGEAAVIDEIVHAYLG